MKDPAMTATGLMAAMMIEKTSTTEIGAATGLAQTFHNSLGVA